MLETAISLPNNMSEPSNPSDHYAHFLSIWDTEESLRERARASFLGLQGALLAVAMIFFQSNRGLFLYFAFIFAGLAYEWFSVTTLRARRLAFVLWAVMKHETEGLVIAQPMSCLRSLDKKLQIDGMPQYQDELFAGIFREYRSADYFVLFGTIFLWILLASIAYTSTSEVELFGNWILDLVGANSL